MSKLGMLAAGAVGYVLGARAGRERYEQIAYQAQRLWTNPKVQRAANQAQDRARDAAPVVAEKVGDAAKHAAAAAVSAVTRNSGDVDDIDADEAGSKVATRDESTGEATVNGTHPQVSHL
ncbi:MAG TPA: YtxH domain-containing protein [Nocardioidaceae bacterium]|nr:YtxH domain-containing protein [Nocardioidaceae bacterium]